MRQSQPGTLGEDDEDDEETLQLRLEALEARLKLKKLQQKKLNASASALDQNAAGNHSGAALKSGSCGGYSSHHKNRELLESEARQPTAVQVMVSPQKRVATKEARSPGRILLGIDKGLKGRNVSLKRPLNSVDKKDHVEEGPLGKNLDQNGLRSISDVAAEGLSGRSKTFSEKIAEIRQRDKVNQERSHKLRKQRSTGFGVQQSELDEFKNAASTIELRESSFAEYTSNEVRFSREEVLRAVNRPTGGLLGRTNTVSSERNSRHKEALPPTPSVPKDPPASTEKPPHKSKKRSIPSPPAAVTRLSSNLSEDPLFEPFSSVQLSKRLIPHAFLTKTIGEKHITQIPSLLATIKSPTYELPAALEDDFVVLGIVASKSSPLSHKDAHKSTTSASTSTSLTEATDSAMNARGKYMVFTLTDLKWSLDLYLFTTAYTRFWKLTPGTLIAILNPSIMPPPPGKSDTGRFSLVLNSSDDTVLEIGTSRDLGWCKSVRKDGKPCDSWVDNRHTELCEWHVDRVVESTRRGRMEVNSISAPYAPGGKRGGRTGYWGSGSSRNNKEATISGKENGLVKERGPQWDRASSSSYFITPRPVSGRRSAASLFDAEVEERGSNSREERLRKRLAEQARELEIARRLGEGGNGIGSEYLQLRRRRIESAEEEAAASIDNAPADMRRKQLGAEELGLKRSASDVKLGSVRKVLREREEERERERESKRVKITTCPTTEPETGAPAELNDYDNEEEDEDDGLDIV